MARILVEESELASSADFGAWGKQLPQSQTTFSVYGHTSSWILLLVLMLSGLLLYRTWSRHKVLIQELYSETTRNQFQFLNKGKQSADSKTEPHA